MRGLRSSTALRREQAHADRVAVAAAWAGAFAAGINTANFFLTNLTLGKWRYSIAVCVMIGVVYWTLLLYHRRWVFVYAVEKGERLGHLLVSTSQHDVQLALSILNHAEGPLANTVWIHALRVLDARAKESANFRGSSPHLQKLLDTLDRWATDPLDASQPPPP